MPIDTLSKLFENAKQNDYKGFHVFAFELPKVPKNKLENEHVSDLKFPCNVVVKKYIDKEWKLLFNKKVNSFSDYGKLKIKTIYNY